MMVIKFRSTSEAKDMLKKAKKMYKFSKEFVDCLEDKIEDEYDDEEEYRYEDDDRMERMSNRSDSYRSRYRRSM